MKTPPLNLSPEAVALRKNALAFGKGADGLEDSDNDPEDTLGQRRNAALLAAALAYGKAVLFAPRTGGPWADEEFIGVDMGDELRAANKLLKPFGLVLRYRGDRRTLGDGRYLRLEPLAK